MPRPAGARRPGGGRPARGGALVVALLTTLGGPFSVASTSLFPPQRPRPALVASAQALAAVGAVAAIPAGARQLGMLAGDTELQVGLALRPRDPGGLARYAAAVSLPSSPEFHHYLTPAQLAARFGPSPSSVRAAEQALKAEGLRVGALPADRLLVPATGTARQVESAFHVRLSSYRLASGSLGWRASGAPLVARPLAATVAGVLGVDQLATAQAMDVPAPGPGSDHGSSGTSSGTGGTSTEAVQAALAGAAAATTPGLPAACPAALQTAMGSGGWTQDAIANAYGFAPLLTNGDLGAGETIAIYELEPFLRSDVATFDDCYFGRSHLAQVRTVRVGPFGLSGPGVGESILDIEDVSALAPDARILVYEAQNTELGQIEEYNTIVSQDRANIVSTSWAECETQAELGSPGILQVENMIFEEAAAEGQTVLAAAGDTGSDSCASTQFGSTSPARPFLSVNDPASQPYVVGVGGVSLDAATSPPQETAWNDGAASGGGGGGRSNTWPSPIWQEDSGVPGTGAGRRQVPDVSASADEFKGNTVFSQAFAGPRLGSSAVAGNWTVIGGTSSSTPQWAAVLAIVADSSSCAGLPKTAGGPDLGFVAPELYAVASDASSYAASFTDVTDGNNDVFRLGDGYDAGPGYNMAAGLGTPVLAGPSGQPGLAANLCAVATGGLLSGPTVPTLTSVSPASGPPAGGGTVTISGSGFSSGDGSALTVQFGSVEATVKSVSAGSIVVTVPKAGVARGSAAFADASTVDVSVTERNGTGTVTSSPSPGARYDYVAATASGVGLPTVTGMAPEAGLPAGGTRVTIFGDGFEQDGGVTSVSFGGVAAHFRVVGDAELIATAPAQAPSSTCSTGAGFDAAVDCQVQVVVSDAAGSSPTERIEPAVSGSIVYSAAGIVHRTRGHEIAESSTEYDYSPRPVILSIMPNPASYDGSSAVTIVGRNFDLNTLEWVDFGPTSSTNSQQVKITYVTPTEITVFPPPAPSVPGTTPVPLAGGVTVQAVQGESNTVPFSYDSSPS